MYDSTGQLSPQYKGYLIVIYGCMILQLLSYLLGTMVSINPYNTFLNVLISISPFIPLFGMTYMYSLRVGNVVESIRYERTNVILSLVTTFLLGVGSSYFFQMVNMIDSTIITQAILYTTTIFLSLTSLVFLFPNVYILSLGGPLLSALNILILSQILNMFFMSYNFFMLETVIGLFVFMGFIVYDTFLLLHNADLDLPNYALRSLGITLDILNIFIRIVTYLLDKKRRD